VQTNGVHVGVVLFYLAAGAFFIYALLYWLGRGMERNPDRDRMLRWAQVFVLLTLLIGSFVLSRSG
jgi:hypothetical protein